MERPPESRKDEQYPLLKVASGMSDTVSPPPPVQTQSWTVSCAPKQSWVNRWPEVVSASWMTLILLAMSFLVFYTLSMGAYKRTPLMFKYNEAQPSSNVFFHHIIHRRCHFPFALYSHFLHSMAVTYPNLRFNTLFLVDDAVRNTYYIPRHVRLSSGLLGFRSKDPKDEMAKQEIRELEMKHSNVNVTVMDLSKYMAMTPLRLKWRTIPVSYLSFYTRIFSVWQNGGIGMDLTTYNNQFCNKVQLDRRITEILKNHNEGLPSTDYKIMLRAIDEEEENCFKSLEQMWNDTLSMFNSVFSFSFPSQVSDIVPLDIMPAIRTQRAKRNVNSNFYEIVTSEDLSSTDSNVLTEIKLNETVDIKANNLIDNNSLKTETSQTTSEQSNLTAMTLKVVEERETKPTPGMTVGYNQSKNNPERPPAILFYDFSIMSDNVGRILSREPMWPPFLPQSFGFNFKSEPVKDIDKKKDTNAAAHLALASDGLFIAATEKLHPFLGMLITAGFQRMRPEYAIQDTIVTQCSGVFKNEAYCNIYGL